MDNTCDVISFQQILDNVDGVVWGIPTIVLILITGIVCTIATRGIQFTKLGLAFKSIFKKNDEGHGELSGFGALCTALSATIGTGNIVGVAAALVAGGPGALVWMWIAAILGTAIKYSECMLAIKYRHIDKDGHIVGGPFYSIEKGLGPKFKWLAVLFALFGALAGIMGIGTMTQINGITSIVQKTFDPDNVVVAFNLFGKSYSWATVISGIIVTTFVALVVIGGVKRISNVASKIVPAMAIIYVALGLCLIVMNITKIPAAFVLIFKSAFGWQAVVGGATGFVFKQVLESMQTGIARGIFSNEAGLGSAPIAASAVKTKEPVEQGLVNMTGTVIDTLIICTMTGLALVIAFYDQMLVTPKWNGSLEGSPLTAAAFAIDLHIGMDIARYFIMLCLSFFAYTTILGWDYYSEKCLEYLTHGKKRLIIIYRWLFILVVFIGPYFTVTSVFTIADIFNGLMAIPNCISLLALTRVIYTDTKSYFDRKNRGK